MKTYMGPLGRVMATALVVAVCVAGLALPLWASVTVEADGSVKIDGITIRGLTEQMIQNDPGLVDTLRAGLQERIRNVKDGDLGTQTKAIDLGDLKNLKTDTSGTDGKIETSGDNAKATPLPGVTMTEARTTDLMKGSQSCIKHSWNPTWNVCCLYSKGKCILYGNRFDINYWEASALIEVSCRTGYSMVNRGKVPTRGGGDTRIQSCQGFNKPGNSRWFFEARVWAINGYDGGVRHQGAGGTNGERMRQCTMESSHGDLPWPGYLSNVHDGYGKKWMDFTRGPQTGPSGSWEGYISDSDPAWAQDGGGADVPAQKACKIGSVDMDKCWGPVTQNGWVSHPNPKVAAALVAWRAHQKAVNANKVSPPGKGGGYKMAMEYPWLEYAGAHGASMGFPDGGKKGSGCFEPGHSGPEWFGGKKPEEIPDLIAGLNNGNVTTVSEINPGVYLFTVWVYTQCTRYEVKFPTPRCHYEGQS